MDNKALIKLYSKALWEHHQFDIIKEVFTSETLIYSPFSVTQGCQAMKEIAKKWLNAFPDLTITWEDFIAEQDKVVSRWRATGTHMGGFFETSPTHKEIQYAGITIYQLADERVINYWALVDMHAILSQLGQYNSISEAIE